MVISTLTELAVVFWTPAGTFSFHPFAPQFYRPSGTTLYLYVVTKQLHLHKFKKNIAACTNPLIVNKCLFHHVPCCFYEGKKQQTSSICCKCPQMALWPSCNHCNHNAGQVIWKLWIPCWDWLQIRGCRKRTLTLEFHVRRSVQAILLSNILYVKRVSNTHCNYYFY